MVAVDVGLAVNPLGLEAQLIGGAMDGIANALTYSLPLKDGYFLEANCDNAYYTREGNVPFDVQVIVMLPTTGKPGGAGELGVAPADGGDRCAYARDRQAAHRIPDRRQPALVSPRIRRARRSRSRRPTDCNRPSRSSDADSHLHPQRQARERRLRGSVRLLWVLRDLLGVHGPKYGCGLEVCKACTSHVNGKVFNPCAVPVSQIKPGDEITTIEGLPATVGKELHPMQEAWLEYDVAQCGYCRPGQIMAAVALVKEVQASGRQITDADLDTAPQHLPLRHVSADPRGDHGRRGRHVVSGVDPGAWRPDRLGEPAHERRRGLELGLNPLVAARLVQPRLERVALCDGHVLEPQALDPSVIIRIAARSALQPRLGQRQPAFSARASARSNPAALREVSIAARKRSSWSDAG